jgi:hypothetical protein
LKRDPAGFVTNRLNLRDHRMTWRKIDEFPARAGRGAPPERGMGPGILNP